MPRHLEGFAPMYTRIDIVEGPLGVYEVRHWAYDRPGFTTAAEADVYDLLCREEALDVVSALVDGVLPSRYEG